MTVQPQSGPRAAGRGPGERAGTRPPVATYTGIAVTVVGFAAIGLAWNGAAELDYVQSQFPFLISGGLTGLGLIIVGGVILLIETLRRDSEDRRAEIARLTATVAGLNRRLAPSDPDHPAPSGEFRPRPRRAGNGQATAQTGELPTAGHGGWERGH